jgi:membrane protease YdiL (CAAX protease family)
MGVVIGLGLLAEMAAWWLISRRGQDVWRVMPPVLLTMGAVAIVVQWGDLRLGTPVWMVAGLFSGVAFYAATRAFVWLASRWEPFRRQTADKYREATEVSLSRSLLLSVALMVPCEELFWRGLTQQELTTTSLGFAGAAIAVWFLYLLANLPSASLPIIAGASVGGALWAGLWWSSHGVLAPLASHILWTGLMLTFPPRRDRR